MIFPVVYKVTVLLHNCPKDITGNRNGPKQTTYHDQFNNHLMELRSNKNQLNQTPHLGALYCSFVQT